MKQSVRIRPQAFMLGLTRQELVEVLGEPDHVGDASRKYRTPSIYKYGDVEYWFQPWKNGILVTIWNEKEEKVICDSR